MIEFVTFLLAPIGYAGLTAVAVLAAHGRLPVALWRATAFVIVTHVSLVWHVRYDWQVSEATRNGYVGFVVFHGALLAILVSLGSAFALARRLIIAAFAAVTVGAVGATFRYEVVEIYRIPVLVCAAAGLLGLARAHATRAMRAQETAS